MAVSIGQYNGKEIKAEIKKIEIKENKCQIERKWKRHRQLIESINE